MRRVVHFYRSTVGKKVTMAVSGAVLLLWLIAHMLGNLKAFLGPDHLNAYAAWLRTMGEPFFVRGQVLWLVRIVLLICVGLHILAATQLTLQSWRARPEGYRKTPHLEISYASRTMRWGGVVLVLYVIYHLMDLTWGTLRPNFTPDDVYHNVVTGFQRWPVSAFYLIALAALALHLYHGVWSGLQTLGLNHPRYNRYRRAAAWIVAVGLFVGFASVPVAVLAGVLR